MNLVPGAALTASQRERLLEISLDALPPEEQADFDSLFADRFLVPIEDDRPVGLAVLRDLADTGWVFLRYFAVGERGAGTGSRFFRALTDWHSDRTRLVLDLEDPDEVTGTDRDLRLRRIGFYERLGAVLPPVRGYAPPHDGVPLRLLPMYADLPGPTRPLDPAGLRELIEAIYEHRYGYPPGTREVTSVLEASGLA